MAVVAVNEIREGRTARKGRDRTTYKRVYHVQTDAASDNPNVALNASFGGTSIPALGSPYPGDLDGAELDDIDVRQIPGQLLYEVVCTYTTEEAGGIEVPGSPTEEPPDIDWSFQASTVTVHRDINGNLIGSSAGELFDPPLEETIHFPFVRIVRNEPSFSPTNARNFIDSVNNAPVVIAGAPVNTGQALMVNMAASSEFERGVAYFRVTYEVLFKPDHRRFVLDHGFQLLETISVNGSTERRPFRATHPITGEPYTHPINLDGTGGRANIDVNGNEIPVFLGFETKTAENWAFLNLPVSFP